MKDKKQKNEQNAGAIAAKPKKKKKVLKEEVKLVLETEVKR